MARLTEDEAGGSITLARFRQELAALMIDPVNGERERTVLSQLADWPGLIGL